LGDRYSSASRPNPGAKQRFIRINVTYAAQKFLIQQCALDRGLAAAEQVDKSLEIDLQWLNTGRVEISRAGDAQSPKTAWIDKPQFPARRQLQGRMRVLGGFHLRIADLQAARHAEMNNPLGLGLRGLWRPCHPALFFRPCRLGSIK